MAFTAFDLVSFAVAVLIGNVMTLALLKGWQRMKREDSFSWVTAAYYLGPLCMIIAVLAITH
jgi:hypothetical protein